MAGNLSSYDTTTIQANGGETYTIASDLFGRSMLRFNPEGTVLNTVNFGSSSASGWVGSIDMSVTGDEKLLLDFSDDHDLDRATMGNLFIGSLGLNDPTYAQLNLDQNFTFQNVRLQANGQTIQLEKGYYKWADLDAITVGGVKASDFFVNSGDFSINIVAVPEPSTGMLIGVGGIILFLRRRIRK